MNLNDEEKVPLEFPKDLGVLDLCLLSFCKGIFSFFMRTGYQTHKICCVSIRTSLYDSQI